MKHTPAPWIIGKHIISDSISKKIIVDYAMPINEQSVEGQANAKLIAAAPELLEECLRAQSEIASACKDGIPEHFTKEMLNRWFKGVSAVISKATDC